ncbi:hypothetical protein SMG44B_10566 [Stenotrophomonas maltophilia]
MILNQIVKEVPLVSSNSTFLNRGVGLN